MTLGHGETFFCRMRRGCGLYVTLRGGRQIARRRLQRYRGFSR